MNPAPVQPSQKTLLDTLPPELHSAIVREVLWGCVGQVAIRTLQKPGLFPGLRRDWQLSAPRILLNHPCRRRAPLQARGEWQVARKEPFRESDEEIQVADALVSMSHAFPAWRRACEAMGAEVLVLDARGDAASALKLQARTRHKVRLLQLYEVHATPLSGVTALSKSMKDPLRPFERALLACAATAGALRALSLGGWCSHLLPRLLEALPKKHLQVTELSVAPTEDVLNTLPKCSNVHTLVLTIDDGAVALMATPVPPRAFFSAISSLPYLKRLTLDGPNLARTAGEEGIVARHALAQAALVETITVRGTTMPVADYCDLVIPFSDSLVELHFFPQFASNRRLAENMPPFPNVQHARLRRTVNAIGISENEVAHFFRLLQHSPLVSLSLDGIDMVSLNTVQQFVDTKLATLKAFQLLDNNRQSGPNNHSITVGREWTNEDVREWVARLDVANVRCDVALWRNDQLVFF